MSRKEIFIYLLELEEVKIGGEEVKLVEKRFRFLGGTTICFRCLRIIWKIKVEHRGLQILMENGDKQGEPREQGRV